MPSLSEAQAGGAGGAAPAPVTATTSERGEKVVGSNRQSVRRLGSIEEGEVVQSELEDTTDFDEDQLQSLMLSRGVGAAPRESGIFNQSISAGFFNNNQAFQQFREAVDEADGAPQSLAEMALSSPHILGMLPEHRKTQVLEEIEDMKRTTMGVNVPPTVQNEIKELNRKKTMQGLENDQGINDQEVEMGEGESRRTQKGILRGISGDTREGNEGGVKHVVKIEIDTDVEAQAPTSWESSSLDKSKEKEDPKAKKKAFLSNLAGVAQMAKNNHRQANFFAVDKDTDMFNVDAVAGQGIMYFRYIDFKAYSLLQNFRHWIYEEFSTTLRFYNALIVKKLELRNVTRHVQEVSSEYPDTPLDFLNAEFEKEHGFNLPLGMIAGVCILERGGTAKRTREGLRYGVCSACSRPVSAGF